MRNLCLILVLLNVMVLGYQRWILAPAEGGRAMPASHDIPLLSLAAPVDVGSPGAKVIDDSAPRCLRLGPFASRDAALAVQRDLRRRGAEVAQSSAEGQVWVGHWVQIEDQGSRPAAETARTRLGNRNIETYILSGDATFALSLGIYRKRSSAERVMQIARDLGYRARMVDRFQDGTVFWLQVSMPGEERLKPGEFQGDSGQILRSELIPC
jgi:hypothetical protein